jgi:hypothetical protein
VLSILFYHLFSSGPWTSLLWRMAKSWFRLHRSMSTINSAIRDFLSGKNNLVGRMCRVSLAILIYLIWEERNKKVSDNSCTSVSFVFLQIPDSLLHGSAFSWIDFLSRWLFLFVRAASISFAVGDGFSRMGLQCWLDVVLLLVVAVWDVLLMSC